MSWGFDNLQPRLAWAFGIVSMGLAISISGVFLLNVVFDAGVYVRHASLLLGVILAIESARQSYRYGCKWPQYLIKFCWPFSFCALMIQSPLWLAKILVVLVLLLLWFFAYRLQQRLAALSPNL
jgi:hypothetical protein